MFHRRPKRPNRRPNKTVSVNHSIIHHFKKPQSQFPEQSKL